VTPTRPQANTDALDRTHGDVGASARAATSHHLCAALGSPPHDRAHRCHICTRAWLAQPHSSSAPGLGALPQLLHRDRARPLPLHLLLRLDRSTVRGPLQHVVRYNVRSATTCGPLQRVVRYNMCSATTCVPLQHVVRYNMKWSATTRGAARAVDLLMSEAASGGIAEEYVASFGRLMSLQAGACLLTQ
jgi:hypothetical protein